MAKIRTWHLFKVGLAALRAYKKAVAVAFLLTLLALLVKVAGFAILSYFLGEAGGVGVKYVSTMIDSFIYLMWAFFSLRLLRKQSIDWKSIWPRGDAFNVFMQASALAVIAFMLVCLCVAWPLTNIIASSHPELEYYALILSIAGALAFVWYQIAMVPFLILDKNMKCIRSIKQSYAMMRGYRWKLFLADALLFLCGALVGLVIFLGLVSFHELAVPEGGVGEIVMALLYATLGIAFVTWIFPVFAVIHGALYAQLEKSVAVVNIEADTEPLTE